MYVSTSKLVKFWLSLSLSVTQLACVAVFSLSFWEEPRGSCVKAWGRSKKLGYLCRRALAQLPIARKEVEKTSAQAITQQYADTLSQEPNVACPRGPLIWG